MKLWKIYRGSTFLGTARAENATAACVAYEGRFGLPWPTLTAKEIV